MWSYFSYFFNGSQMIITFLKKKRTINLINSHKFLKLALILKDFLLFLAERQGFEPWVPLTVHTLSKRAL